MLNKIEKFLFTNKFKFLWVSFSALPGVIVIIYKIAILKNKFKIIPYIVENHPYLFVMWLLAIPIGNYFFDYLKEKKYYEVFYPIEIQTLLTRQIDKPVEAKQDRFLNYLKKNIWQNSIDVTKIFIEITHPQQQLDKITESIFTFFEGSFLLMKLKEIKAKVLLVKFNNNGDIDEDSIFYYPPSDYPGDKLLEDKNSIIHIAYAKEEIILIEDIEQARIKKEISEHCETREGSAIAYPVRCRHIGIVPYVIRIVITKKNILTKKIKFFMKKFLTDSQKEF